MKKSGYRLAAGFVLLLSLIYSGLGYAQNLTGTWKGKLTIDQVKYDYDFYLFKTSEGYVGVARSKEKTSVNLNNLFVNVPNISLGSLSNMHVNANGKSNAFDKKQGFKSRLIGSFNNGSLSYMELGLLVPEDEKNLPNLRFDAGKLAYSKSGSKEKLTGEGLGPVELVKESNTCPSEYDAYQQAIISLSPVKFTNGRKDGKVRYNDTGTLSFTVANKSLYDFSGITLALTVRDGETGLEGLNGNSGSFSLAKGSSTSPEIDLVSNFGVPKDSIHLAVMGTYKGIPIFSRQVALATTPFYLNEAIAVAPSSSQVLRVLQGYYGLNEARHTPIKAGLEQFVQGGNKLAPMWKAVFLAKGKGGYTDDEEAAVVAAQKAYPHVLSAARNGDAEGNYLMFYAVGLGLAGEPSREVAGMFLKKAADASFPPAMFDYALYLMKDAKYAESYQCLQQCNRLGMRCCLTTMGNFFQNGYQVEKSIEQAVQWYRQGDEFGDPDAMMMMARLYSVGAEGIAKDARKAVAYAAKAAALKDASAINYLARIYLNGRTGVPKNVPKAIALYKEAASLGDHGAMTALAYLYLNGLPGSVAKNETTAMVWATKSAQAGGANCMMLLADSYANSKIKGKQDIIKSRFWANQARLRGVGEGDGSAQQQHTADWSNFISNIDLSDQHTIYEDTNTGQLYSSNDGPDLVGGFLSGFLGAYSKRRSQHQKVVNGLRYMYRAGSKKVYGGTLTSRLTTTMLLERGQRVNIKGYGTVNVGMMAGSATPDGIAGFQNYSVDPSIPHAAVMAGVNGKWTYVGREKIFIAPADGVLQLGVNDADYSSNVGYFDVVVVVD